MAPDGSNVVNLTKAIEASHRASSPAWSPDGSKIAYWRRTGGFFTPTITGVALIPRGGGSYRMLVRSNGIASAPVWSPDGSKIAYAGAAPEAASDVTVIPAGGGSPSILEASPGHDIPTSWK